MNIGEAIEAMRHNDCVRRAGWNGKHIYLEDMWRFPIRAGVYQGEERKYAPVLVLYIGATDTHHAGWNPSTEDLLADNWEIVPREELEAKPTQQPALISELEKLAAAAARIVEDDNHPTIVHMRELDRCRASACRAIEEWKAAEAAK